MERVAENNIYVHIKEYWIIYAFIFQVVFNYAGYKSFAEATNNSLERNEQRIISLELQQKTESVLRAEINSRLSSIETSLIFIKEDLRR